MMFMGPHVAYDLLRFPAIQQQRRPVSFVMDQMDSEG